MFIFFARRGEPLGNLNWRTDKIYLMGGVDKKTLKEFRDKIEHPQQEYIITKSQMEGVNEMTYKPGGGGESGRTALSDRDNLIRERERERVLNDIYILLDKLYERKYDSSPSNRTDEGGMYNDSELNLILEIQNMISNYGNKSE